LPCVHTQFKSNFHISIRKVPWIHTHCGIGGVSGVGAGRNADASGNENVPGACTAEAESRQVGGLQKVLD
jgi:hypothetical protein